MSSGVQGLDFESLARWCCHKVVPGAAQIKAGPAWQHQVGRRRWPAMKHSDEALCSCFMLCLRLLCVQVEETLQHCSLEDMAHLAESDPEEVWHSLAKKAGSLATKWGISQIRSSLAHKLPEGVSWTDMETVLQCMKPAEIEAAAQITPERATLSCVPLRCVAFSFSPLPDITRSFAVATRFLLIAL